MDIMVSAYLDNNIGDDLMLKLLANRFPQHQFLLYTDKSTIANTFTDIANIQIRKSTDWVKDIDRAKAHISVGGSIFQVVSRRQKIWRMKRIYRLSKLKRRKMKLATLGSNFGPYSDRWGPKLTEWELRKNDLVTVRDKEALAYLDTFKRMKKYLLADDIVYNLDPRLLNLPSEERRGLGISAYRSIRKGETNYQNFQALAALADAYIEKTGKRVSLFAFDSEKENDLVACHYIRDMAVHKGQIDIVPYMGNDRVFLKSFSSCECLVAIRFHSAILADIFQIPFLPVIYSNKMENLLKDRAFEGLSIKLSDLTKDLDMASLAEDLIRGDRLFRDFMGDSHQARLHFDCLEALLEEV